MESKVFVIFVIFYYCCADSTGQAIDHPEDNQPTTITYINTTNLDGYIQLSTLDILPANTSLSLNNPIFNSPNSLKAPNDSINIPINAPIHKERNNSSDIKINILTTGIEPQDKTEVHSTEKKVVVNDVKPDVTKDVILKKGGKEVSTIEASTETVENRVVQPNNQIVPPIVTKEANIERPFRGIVGLNDETGLPTISELITPSSIVTSNPTTTVFKTKPRTWNYRYDKLTTRHHWKPHHSLTTTEQLIGTSTNSIDGVTEPTLHHRFGHSKVTSHDQVKPESAATTSRYHKHKRHRYGSNKYNSNPGISATTEVVVNSTDEIQHGDTESRATTQDAITTSKYHRYARYHYRAKKSKTTTIRIDTPIESSNVSIITTEMPVTTRRHYRYSSKYKNRYSSHHYPHIKSNKNDLNISTTEGNLSKHNTASNENKTENNTTTEITTSTAKYRRYTPHIPGYYFSTPHAFNQKTNRETTTTKTSDIEITLPSSNLIDRNDKENNITTTTKSPSSTTSIYDRYRHNRVLFSRNHHFKTPKTNNESQNAIVSSNQTSSSHSNININENDKQNVTATEIPSITSIYERLRHNRKLNFRNHHIASTSTIKEIQNTTASSDIKTSLPQESSSLDGNTKQIVTTVEIPSSTSIYDRFRHNRRPIFRNHHIPTSTTNKEIKITTDSSQTIKPLPQNNSNSDENKEIVTTTETPSSTSIYERFRNHRKPNFRNHHLVTSNTHKETQTSTIYSETKPSLAQRNLNVGENNQNIVTTTENQHITNKYDKYTRYPNKNHITPRALSARMTENTDIDQTEDISNDGIITTELPTTSTSIYDRYRRYRKTVHTNHLLGSTHNYATTIATVTSEITKPSIHITDFQVSPVEDIDDDITTEEPVNKKYRNRIHMKPHSLYEVTTHHHYSNRPLNNKGNNFRRKHSQDNSLEDIAADRISTNTKSDVVTFSEDFQNEDEYPEDATLLNTNRYQHFRNRFDSTPHKSFSKHDKIGEATTTIQPIADDEISTKRDIINKHHIYKGHTVYMRPHHSVVHSEYIKETNPDLEDEADDFTTEAAARRRYQHNYEHHSVHMRPDHSVVHSEEAGPDLGDDADDITTEAAGTRWYQHNYKSHSVHMRPAHSVVHSEEADPDSQDNVDDITTGGEATRDRHRHNKYINHRRPIHLRRPHSYRPSTEATDPADFEPVADENETSINGKSRHSQPIDMKIKSDTAHSRKNYRQIHLKPKNDDDFEPDSVENKDEKITLEKVNLEGHSSNKKEGVHRRRSRENSSFNEESTKITGYDRANSDTNDDTIFSNVEDDDSVFEATGPEEKDFFGDTSEPTYSTVEKVTVSLPQSFLSSRFPEDTNDKANNSKNVDNDEEDMMKETNITGSTDNELNQMQDYIDNRASTDDDETTNPELVTVDPAHWFTVKSNESSTEIITVTDNGTKESSTKGELLITEMPITVANVVEKGEDVVTTSEIPITVTNVVEERKDMHNNTTPSITDGLTEDIRSVTEEKVESVTVKIAHDGILPIQEATGTMTVSNTNAVITNASLVAKEPHKESKNISGLIANTAKEIINIETTATTFENQYENVSTEKLVIHNELNTKNELILMKDSNFDGKLIQSYPSANKEVSEHTPENVTANPLINSVVPVDQKGINNSSEVISETKSQHLPYSEDSKTDEPVTQSTEVYYQEVSRDSKEKFQTERNNSFTTQEVSRTTEEIETERSDMSILVTQENKKNEEQGTNVSLIVTSIFGNSANFSIAVKTENSTHYIPSNVNITEDAVHHILNFTWPSNETITNTISLNLRKVSKQYIIDSVQLCHVKDGNVSVWMKNVIQPQGDNVVDKLCLEMENGIQLMFSNIDFLTIAEEENTLKDFQPAAAPPAEDYNTVLTTGITIGVLVVLSLVLTNIFIIIKVIKRRKKKTKFAVYRL